METSKTEIAVLFGGQVQHLRGRIGLSQGELSERAGVSQTYLSAIERGDKFPAGTTIESLARALGVPIYLLFVDPNLPRQTEEEALEGISRLNADLAQMVTAWARENLAALTRRKT